MKTIEIIGKNYFGSWNKSRVACRGIVVRDSLLLMSYEAGTGLWMIPGGGLEGDEDEGACCVREVAEETGCVIEVSPCMLEIDEYYEEWKYVSRYFFGAVKGACERHLTAREAQVGLEPRWLPVEAAVDIFSRHADYAETDEMKRGIYLREYRALRSLFGERLKG